MNWFVYDPGTQLVHQEERCITSLSDAKRRRVRQVGNSSLATFNEAVKAARDTLAPEEQPCPRWQREVAIDRGLSDSEWREMLQGF